MVDSSEPDSSGNSKQNNQEPVAVTVSLSPTNQQSRLPKTTQRSEDRMLLAEETSKNPVNNTAKSDGNHHR